MAYKLEVKKADDSIYCIEYANTSVELEAWIAEEQLKFYWDVTNTHTITEVVQNEPSAQSIINQNARIYLASTDWYVIRAIEDPTKPVPENIATARQTARASIV